MLVLVPFPRNVLLTFLRGFWSVTVGLSLCWKEHTQISVWSRVTGHTMDWGGPGEVHRWEMAAAPKELCVEA